MTGSSWQRKEYAWLVGLFLLALITRWPLRGTFLEEFDSANYAIALHEINLPQHYPHPPGYIFFVWTSRFARLFTNNDIDALTAVNTVSGALSAVLFYALLRVSLAPFPALLSALLSLFSAQVWFQHVRPLEDSFAFLWMLAAAYPFVRAFSGDQRWWTFGMFMLGLSAGAKQILPLFLAGLPIPILWELARRRRFRAILAGVLATLLGSLFWMVPLSLHAGSFQDYIAWALTQLEWQRREALVVNRTWADAYDRGRATFVLIWASPSLVWPLWVLVGTGALDVLRRRRGLQWILWLVAPLLLVRFFLLGYWTRFSIYYLPFLLALAVCGLRALVDLGVGAFHRFRRASSEELGAAPRLEARWLGLLGVAGLGLWANVQLRYILPTLRTLHSERAPVVQAMDFVRKHYDAPDTLILLPDDEPVITRHVQYYASQGGFAYIYERFLTPAQVRGKKTVLRVQGGSTPRVPDHWRGESERLGFWRLKVPHWEDLSLWDEIWQVGLFKLTGSYVVFYDWHEEGLEGALGARCADASGSTVLILHVPPEGLRILLSARAPSMPHGSLPPRARFRVNKRLLYRWEGQQEFAIDVPPEAVVNRRVRIDVRPDCGTAEGSSAEPGRGDCFCLKDLQIEKPKEKTSPAP